MNILYFGKICDKELYTIMEKSEQNPYSIAQYSYEKAFCDEACRYCNMDIISVYQMKNFPKGNLFFHRKKRNYQNTHIKYIPYINIPFIKEMCYFIYTCICILLWNIKQNNKECKYFFANIHYPPVSLAIVLMGKLLRIKKVITFTDISLFTYSKERIRKMPLYKKLIIKPYVKMVNALQESYDLYVLFSKPMNEIVNKRNRPYIVMEGIYNAENLDLAEIEKKRAIVHAGTLNREVGIDKILEVFKQIEDPNIELWLIGKGDMDLEIEKASKNDKRIKFLGFMTRKDVFEYLKKATLLINLRNPNDVYTKYSFPSKTFEYMVSGTPFLTTKLEGIPDEYYKYLYTCDSFETNDIKKIIKEILSKDEKELKKFGNQARNFILNDKNAKVQVCAVIRFLEKNGGQ